MNELNELLRRMSALDTERIALRARIKELRANAAKVLLAAKAADKAAAVEARKTLNASAAEKRLERLRIVAAAMDRGEDAKTIGAALGVSAWRSNQLMAQVRRLRMSPKSPL